MKPTAIAACECLEQRQLLSVAPSMVVDANDAQAHLSMNANQLTAVGDAMYFSASIEGSGTGLWLTDGTPSGTVLVKEIPQTGAYEIKPRNLANVAGTLFFWTNDGNEYSLWTSNGSESGTTPLKEFGTTGTLSVGSK